MIDIQRAPGSAICVVKPVGDLDFLSVPELQSTVDEAMSSGCRMLVCDLSGVTYMDSSALAFLVWADRRLEPVDGRLVLAGANADVSRIIGLSGLVGVAPTVTAAGSVDEVLLDVELPTAVVEPMYLQSFSFPAEAGMMASVRARIADAVAPFGLHESAQFDLKVAVGEALANAVRHGSPRGPGDKVSVDICAYPDWVTVSVSDSGCGFDGEPREESDLYAANGRGVLFMRALADRVEFGPSECGGTCVRLAKRRTPAAQAASA